MIFFRFTLFFCLNFRCIVLADSFAEINKALKKVAKKAKLQLTERKNNQRCVSSVFGGEIISLHNATGDYRSATMVAWSHIKESNRLKIKQPKYPLQVIVKLDNTRINTRAGALFDLDGCLYSYATYSQDWPQRVKSISRTPTQPINISINSPSSSHTSLKSSHLKYDYDEVIFIWGSMYCVDWQHAVIDFLPLFDIAIDLIIQKPHAPILVGPYIKYFKDIFPFNISSRFINRDFNWPKSVAGNPEIIPDLLLAKRVYLIDFLYRQQSYIIRGSFDGLKPFLHSSFRYDFQKSKEWLQQRQQYQQKLGSSRMFKRPVGYPQSDRAKSNMMK
jgi:hypothetical protein